jgi:hypothetical protein
MALNARLLCMLQVILKLKPKCEISIKALVNYTEKKKTSWNE